MIKRNFSKIKLAPYFIYGGISLLIVIIILISVIFLLPHHNFLIARGLIGDKWFILNLLLITTLICAVNIINSFFIFKRDIVSSHILGSVSIFILLMFLLRVVSILINYL